MAIITLFCADSHSLKLGPGEGLAQVPGSLIVFLNHYAFIDEDEFPEWESWLRGAPHIDVLEKDDIPESPGADFTCDLHDPVKSFASAKALNGHRLSHVDPAAKAAAKAARDAAKAAETSTSTE